MRSKNATSGNGSSTGFRYSSCRPAKADWRSSLPASAPRSRSVDEESRRQDIEGRILAAGLRDEIHFTVGSLTELPENLCGEPFDIIVIRRGLCGMRYGEARQVVRQLMRRLKIGGKLYLSILGLHSELSEAYAGSEAPIDQRFAELAPAMISKYGIRGPVCLYSERNLFMLLLEAGASVLRTLTTTYGNVKGIAVRV